MKFSTWHDTCAAVGCAQLCSNMQWSYIKINFRRIWCTIEKMYVKWAPEQNSQTGDWIPGPTPYDDKQNF